MIIAKRVIPRRTVLRGLGAAVALPLLEAMVPAATALSQTPAKAIRRFGAVYVPNGVIPDRWFPAAVGSNFEFSYALKALEPFRDRLKVLGGLDSDPVRPPGAPGAVHARASTKFLTNVHPSRALKAGISMDQLAARELGRTTQLPSLELALDTVDAAATCDDGSCIYTGTISWAGPTSPLPMETDPAAVFERLFGEDTTDPAARRASALRKTSILDSVLEEVSQLKNKVGPSDQSRLTGYLESVRAVEQRIQRAVEQNVELPAFDRPAGVPGDYAEHARLMFDLQVIAFQADITRVCTFMMGREFNGRTYPEIGVPDSHHPISHHRNDPEKMDKCAQINRYHTQLFSHLLEKLAATPDGDGSLLDQVVIKFGAGMNDGNGHTVNDLPIVLAGGGAGRLEGGQYIRYKKGTPLANLHVALLDKLGVPVESFGNSTARLELDYLGEI